MRLVDCDDELLVTRRHPHEPHRRHLNRIPCHRHKPEVVPSGSVRRPMIIHGGH